MSEHNPWSTWPAAVETGRSDFSARVAETGVGYETESEGVVDWWDWQRRVSISTVQGEQYTVEYPPNGWIRALDPDEDQSWGSDE